MAEGNKYFNTATVFVQCAGTKCEDEPCRNRITSTNTKAHTQNMSKMRARIKRIKKKTTEKEYTETRYAA